MAGIMFTDGKLVLCGYSQHKSQITGIGGKAHENEQLVETAIRETIEELFEFEVIPEALLRYLKTCLSFDHVIGIPAYTVFVMSFTDLQKILDILKMFVLKSDVYSEIPTNLSEMIFNRKVNFSSELSHLILLPCADKIKLESNLLNDIYVFKNSII